MKFYLSLFLMILVLSPFQGWSQDVDEGFSSFLERYEAYRKLMPLEKLYVHIDQTSYYPEEDMHFTLHVLNGMTNQYDSALSVTAYLEVINDHDSIVIRKPIRLDEGRAYGILALDSLKANSAYRLRSYTNWMRNLGVSGYYEQPFAIIDPDMAARLEIPDLEVETSVSSKLSRLELSNPEWLKLKFSPSTDGNKDYLFMIESQQHIVYSAIMSTHDGLGEVAVRKTMIPMGHFRIVILNRDMEVVDELVAFNDYQHLDYELEATDISKEKRKRQYGLLTIYDQDGAPVEGEFSVAIRHQEPSYIKRWSLTDFFGMPYQNQDEMGTSSAINWLDLSEKFNLDQLEDYQFMENTMAIGGQVLQPNGKPSPSTDINMFVNAKVPFYSQTKSNQDGQFIVPNLYFEDSATLVLSEAKSKRLDFTVYPLWPKPATGETDIWSVSIQPKALDETSSMGIGIDGTFKLAADDIILEEVEIEAKKEREDIKKGVVRLYGRSDITIDENTVNFNSGIYASVFEIVAGRVTSYIPPPRGGPGGTFARVSSTSSSIPLCLLNGTPTDCEALGSIPVQLIGSVDVSPKAMSMFGGRGSNGLIAVYTIAAEPRKTTLRKTNPTAYTFSVEGYHPQDLPEMPDYSTKGPQHIKPDYRRTLYWNPNVSTDDYGSMYLPFYMNDLPELNYVIEVEGVDNNGRFVSLQVPLFEE